MGALFFGVVLTDLSNSNHYMEGYSEFRLSNYPSATALINDYAQGKDPTNSIGPYWEQPGRSIVDNHLLDIPHPQEVAPGQFYDFTRIFFRGPYRCMSTRSDPELTVYR